MNIEDYKIKRKNFKLKVNTLFQFLVEDYGYSSKYKKLQQPNGFVTSDSFIFEHNNKNRKIEVSNNYHPNDYGFELTVYDTSKRNYQILKRKSPYLILKKRQCGEQNYLKHISDDFKEKHLKIISGKEFYEDTSEYSIAKSKNNNGLTLKNVLLWLLILIALFVLQKIFK